MSQFSLEYRFSLTFCEISRLNKRVPQVEFHVKLHFLVLV